MCVCVCGYLFCDEVKDVWDSKVTKFRLFFQGVGEVRLKWWEPFQESETIFNVHCGKTFV